MSPSTHDESGERAPLLPHRHHSQDTRRRSTNPQPEDGANHSHSPKHSHSHAHDHTDAMASSKKKLPWYKLDKKKRILIFIVVDIIFFLIEIVAGYTAHSLALVADAFHMLNDVISLCVGYWAVSVAENRSSSNEYTYGWVRGEILGGFVNGVFLIALCMSIILEAIQRFFEPQVVKNPKLVLIVGAVGLAFNILGLFVFHQHSHGHDHGHGDEGETHSHEQADELSQAESGHGHAHPTEPSKTPQAMAINSEAQDDEPRISMQSTTSHRSGGVTWSEDTVTKNSENASLPKRRTSVSSRNSRHRRSGSRSIDDLPIHPASLRNEIIAQARYREQDTESDVSAEEVQDQESSKDAKNDKPHPISHHNHKHTQPKPKSASGGHGHNHEDMNTRGIFLHVLGDALGNLGVMASALIIWLTPWSFRYYFDPIISLLITLIILKSAIPLVKEAGRSLLQATPKDISVSDIKEDIETLPGVRSCHHVHVWALTAAKRIATLHVELDFDFQGAGSARYMDLAMEIQKCLHEHGVHSSTVQPEFWNPGTSQGNGSLSPSHVHAVNGAHGTGLDGAHPPLGQCLLDCEEGETDKKCCDGLATHNGHDNTNGSAP